MKQIVILLTIALVLSVSASAFCLKLDANEAYLGNCNQMVNKGEYVDAGCCFKQIEEYGDCILYLLKGAHEAEILWDGGDGDYDKRNIALEYYNTEFYPSSGLGSDMGVCLNGYNDADLKLDVNNYYDWMVYKEMTEDAPYDMNTKIKSLENVLHPKAPVSTATPQPSLFATATPEPSLVATPPTPEDNTGVLLIVAVILVAIVVVLITQKDKIMPKKHSKEQGKEE